MGMAQMATVPAALRRYEVMAHATESLDGKDNAMTWLQKPSTQFNGKTPQQVLDSGDLAEMQQLDEILTALDYGMHS